MTLREFKDLLEAHADRPFRLLLPDGDPVPVSFHVTEVGRVRKTFLDCGGTLRETDTCQLQVWVGDDDDHRLAAGKLAAILAKASAFLTDETVPVEIEYEDEVISQYPVASAEVGDEAVVLRLARKHTDCLAPEKCGLPSLRNLPRRSFAVSPCGPGASPSCCG
jgi:hypothetical protein